jgi:hypothetical protein
MAPSQLGAGLPPRLASTPGLVGSVASVLNLALTAAIGVALMDQWASVDARLRGLGEALERVESRVEIGFLRVHRQLDGLSAQLSAIEVRDEIKLSAGLTTAASLAWSATGMPTSSSWTSASARWRSWRDAHLIPPRSPSVWPTERGRPSGPSTCRV